MATAVKKAKAEPKWWAVVGGINNHTYKLGKDGVQRCHLCAEVEAPLKVSSGKESTDRAAMHMVHGVKAHLDVTAKEWNAA